MALDAGDYDEMKRLLLACLDIQETIGDLQCLAKLYTGLGFHALEQGNYDESELFMKESLAFYQQMGDSLAEARGATFFKYITANARQLH